MVSLLAHTLVVLALSILVKAATPRTKLSAVAQEYFDASMALGDSRYDANYGYIWYSNNGPWATRFTAWYVPGLLYRNKGQDVANAEKAIRSIIATQMNYDFDSPWYGDYKLAPDEPNPTTEGVLYPQQIYNTYDPNWREFIGSTLAQAVAEFEHLLDPGVVKEIETSLAYAAIGAMRRNGTAPDNLILGYTNPQLMSIFTIGWIGERLKNKTFVDFANKMGTEVFELFTANGSNTFTEYNCPTYYGIDTFALAASIKYGPKNSTLTQHAPYMLTELWKDIADHYNPYLGNMVGPYDRAYARDLPTHSAIVGQFWWGMFGYEHAPLPWKGNDDLRYDLAQGPSLALLMETTRRQISDETAHKLLTPFEGERFLNKTIRTDLHTDVLRVAQSWLSKELIIGGQTVAETVNRGKQFVPVIAHWASDKSHKPYPYGGWFSLYPSASTITSEVGAGSLSISYPNTTQAGTDHFTYMVGGIPPKWNLDGNVVDGFSKLPCLNVNVSAPGLEVQPTIYWGNNIYNHYYYNVTYVVPENFAGIPKMSFELEYTC